MEAIGLLLYLTVVFIVEFVAACIALGIAVSKLLVKLMAALWRAAVAEVRLRRARAAAPRELAVKGYPRPRQARPRPRVPPKPPGVLR